MELKVVGAKAEPTGRWAETEKVSKFKSFDENLWGGHTIPPWSKQAQGLAVFWTGVNSRQTQDDSVLPVKSRGVWEV